MNDRPDIMIRRRDIIGAAIAGVGAATLGVVASEPAPAKAPDLKDKRRPRYRADSAEVQNFYRVNKYPVR